MKTGHGNDADQSDEAHQSNQAGLENLGAFPSPGRAIAAGQQTSIEVM